VIAEQRRAATAPEETPPPPPPALDAWAGIEIPTLELER